MEQSSTASPITPTVANITTTISTSTISTATTSSATATTTTSSSSSSLCSSSTAKASVQQSKIYDFRKDQDYIQLLMKDLDKLDPEKNGLHTVPKEITSSILTTRLRGVCKINRLIDHANDMCLSFNELGSDKHNEHIDRLRDWILKNKIIEHIFGPNCHVEIIKQSHTILNFVAFSLDNEQVNVIWSASSLKHCGRQVLDLLTSLIRSMRAGPVLHLYWLVKNLNVEEHTEHTLILTSHILRFIWSHSPCINQIEFCSTPKNQQTQQSPSHSSIADSASNRDQQYKICSKQDMRHNDSKPQQQQQSYSNISRRKYLQRRYQQLQHATRQSAHNSKITHSDADHYHRDDDDHRSINSKENISRVVRKNSPVATTSTIPTSVSSSGDNGCVSLINNDEMQWYTECVAQNRQDIDEQSVDYSQATSDDSSHEKNLHQTLMDAIKGVADRQVSSSQHDYRRQNSPVGANGAVIGGSDCDVNDYNGSDDDRNADFNGSIKIDRTKTNIQQKSSHAQERRLTTFAHEATDSRYETTINDEEGWLEQLRDDDVDILDFASDISVCCSEEKDMGDFDDESQNFFQDENALDENIDDPGANLSDNMVDEVDEEVKKSNVRAALNTLDSSQKFTKKDYFDSGSTTRDSEAGKSPPEPNVDNLQQLSHESVSQFAELKTASLTLTNITSQICADEDLKKLSEYNLANLADQGKTLLWDLLQDGKIEHLAPNLHLELENVLVSLIMSSGDRYIRYRFIEACLENLSSGTSVIISLRLLPRLMSFNTMTRNLSLPAVNETYTIVLWAEREHNMSKNFFKNLVEDHKCRQAMQSHGIVKSELSTENKNDESQEVAARGPYFSHLDAIITRMSFLTFIYSKPFSPIAMRLDKEQMDQLWDCLATEDTSRCSDVLFQWIYQQAVGEDFHGVDDELLDYILKHKLPTLPPENFRLRGLKLLEQLLWIRQDYECCHELKHPATRLLWDIALKAADDEVSLAAIRILNHFYIYNNHQKPITCKQGTNFMRYCMEHMQSSFLALGSSINQIDISRSLDVMQRVLLLIRTHLEVFKAHWSYYLRMLQLNNEADLISHRLNAYDIKLTMTIRLICQAASSTAKTTIEVQSSDFMGELRAEIVKWWYCQVDRSHYEQSAELSPTSSHHSVSPSSANQQNDEEQHQSNQTLNLKDNKGLNSFTKFLLNNHHSLRLLSLNQEIPYEWDERQINELDFKDMQVIYVLSDARRASVVDSADELESNNSDTKQPTQISNLPEISSIPSIVLQNQENFELLMDTDNYLGSFRSDNTDIVNRSKALSRRVWEIIQILPTNPHYRQNFKRCGSNEDSDSEWTLKVPTCAHLMSAECPQRLLYSLQIIDILRSSLENPYWATIFIRKGGLADLYDVFMSQKLLPDDNEDWNEWLQECLAYLLKLLFQIGTKPIASPGSYDCQASGSSEQLDKNLTSSPLNRISTTNSGKKVRRNRQRVVGVVEDRVMIPLFSDELSALLDDTELIFDKLMRILKSSAVCRSRNEQYYYMTMSSRAMIVHHVMGFLSSWCKSDPKFPKIQIQEYESLLKALILDDTDPSSRREACTGFLKLHYACVTRFIDTSSDSNASTTSSDSSITSEGSTNNSINEHQNSSKGLSTSQLSNKTFSAELLACLVKFLPIAESMKPPRSIRSCLSESEYIRELNSPGCKDYFWLTCRLIDAPNTCRQKIRMSTEEINEDQSSTHREATTDGMLKLDNPSRIASQVTSPIDLHELCEYLVLAIRRRPVFETRDYSVEDDALRGMLMMMVMAIRRDPSFRYTELAGQFILELYNYLFAAPTEKCRFLPKCKSGPTRSTAFDLMLGLVECCPKNYMTLITQLLQDQHQAVTKGAHPSEYWPHDDCRSEVGFVGLINLGATCYLATCMQHLFMIPDLRYAVLSIKDTKNLRHGDILQELQKIFTFLLESERKAYNPRNFCKVYTMDNHPLNIAEQTDMTEFLTDLITKLEESSPGLRHIIKSLFSGTLSNNVVSLDCPHISRTTEEFYTLRVQVADMRNLNDSLDELTVKDTLEGDNMYTCSTCERKVRAEKRACIVKLPRILCFNTMRYTFNMATMTKEKVNTHFSFPLRLDMADYLESNLMKRQQSPTNVSHHGSSSSSHGSFSSGESSPHGGDNTINENNEQERNATSPKEDTKNKKQKIEQEQERRRCENNSISMSDTETWYELIGVTVHTGNADGGHYYCFIRDCEDQTTDKPKWYLFNDAEVKPFDDSHIGTECYGGELTTKSYDAINDRFMDFSIEKTNSAYMLFYKRVDYKFRSKSVATRYLESDLERSLIGLGGSQDYSIGKPNIDRPNDTLGTDDSKEYDLEEESYQSQNMDTLTSAEVMGETSDQTDFDRLCHTTYNDFVLPRHLANWIWNDNLRFSRDQFIFEHNYFDFIWQTCANVSRTLVSGQKNLINIYPKSYFDVPDDKIAIETVHLSIIFVLGVLMKSRERPNLSNWTELIRKQFNSSRAACYWLMQLADDDDTWLKQLIQKCPIEIVRQLFQRLCSDLTGINKQHKKMRFVK